MICLVIETLYVLVSMWVALPSRSFGGYGRDFFLFCLFYGLYRHFNEDLKYETKTNWKISRIRTSRRC